MFHRSKHGDSVACAAGADHRRSGLHRFASGDELLAHGYRGARARLSDRRRSTAPAASARLSRSGGRADRRRRARSRCGAARAAGCRRRCPSRRARRRRPEHVRARRVHRDEQHSAPRCCSRRSLDRPVERLVVASSMSVYGEGCYVARTAATPVGAARRAEQLARGEWEPVDEAGRPLAPVPTPETKPPALASVYALSKYDQERLCLMFGAAYGIPTVALALLQRLRAAPGASNPYTGVLAIFAVAPAERPAAAVFEDGRQRRDFVSVARRRPRLPARARERRGGGQRVQRRQRRRQVVLRDRRRSSREVLGQRDRASESPASTGSATSATASPTSRWRAELLGYEPRSTSRRGWRSSRHGSRAERGRPRRAGARRARRAGADGDRRPRDRTVLITGGAGFIGTNLADRLLAQGRRVRRARQPLAPGVEQNLRWLREKHGDRRRGRRSPTSATAPPSAPSLAGVDAVFHFAAQVAVTTSLDDPLDDFDVNAARHARRARGAAPAPRAAAAPVHLDEQGLRRRCPTSSSSGVDDRWQPVDAASCAGAASTRRAPLDFHSPYGCSKGARRPVRARLRRARYGLPRRRVPHELHLRAAPVRHRGPGLGRALPDPRARRRADHDLRRRPQVRDVLFVDDLVDAMLRA